MLVFDIPNELIKYIERIRNQYNQTSNINSTHK